MIAWVALATVNGRAAQEPAGAEPGAVHDPVAQLQRRIDQGRTTLQFEPKHGYLQSLLRELNVPASSQSLVFSKTSFQRDHISPWRPRALYFNDDVYAGWVQGGDVIELASIDSRQGAIFYLLKQEAAPRPQFIRQSFDCMECHQSALTHDVPGLIIRSVYPDSDGQPILTAGTFLTSDQSPLKERWGGWYASGTCGRQRHMANVIVEDEEHADRLGRDDNIAGANIKDLGRLFPTAPYLTPDSDIVALMVFQHQAQIHNLISRTAIEVRAALRDEAVVNQALGQPAGQRSASTVERIESSCEPLVKAMLFSGEAGLTDRVAGTSSFAKEFAARGVRDPKGRSLRDFDLQHRLFKYPCSYLIYSDSFNEMPAVAREYVYHRLFQVLTGRDDAREFANLSDDDRDAIMQILRATKHDLPVYWNR